MALLAVAVLAVALLAVAVPAAGVKSWQRLVLRRGGKQSVVALLKMLWAAQSCLFSGRALLGQCRSAECTWVLGACSLPAKPAAHLHAQLAIFHGDTMKGVANVMILH